MQYQLTQETKNQLDDEFKELNTDHDSNISKDEFFFYLDKICDGKFDRYIASEFFDKIPKNPQGRVTFNEFRNIYVDAWKASDAKITELTKRKDELTVNKNNDEKDKVIAQQYFQEDNGGVKTKKKLLKVSLHEADNVAFESANISLFLNDQAIKAKVVHVKSGKTQIERPFEFIVGGLDSALNVKIEDAVNRGVMSYENVIQLNSLSNQKKKISWIDLFGIANKKTETRLRLTLQYIYDSDKLFDEVIGTWNAEIISCDAQIAELKLFQGSGKTFPASSVEQPEALMIKDFIKDLVKNKYYLAPTAPSDYIGYGPAHAKKTFFNTANQDSPIVPIMTLTSIVATVYAIMCMFTIEYRYPMPDLVLICQTLSMNEIQRPAWICFRYVAGGNKVKEEYASLMYNTEQKFIEKTAASKQLNSIAWLCLYSFLVLVIDIVWCVFYFNKYWNSAYVDNAEQKFCRTWCVVVSCILPVCNLVMFICLIISGKKAPEFKKAPVF